MAKPGRPSPGLDDYLYRQERLSNRETSGLSIDEFCADARALEKRLADLEDLCPNGEEIEILGIEGQDDADLVVDGVVR